MLNQAMGGSCQVFKITSGDLETSHFECWLLVNKCSYFFMSPKNVLIGAIHSKSDNLDIAQTFMSVQ